MNKKLFAIAFGVLAMFACKEPEPEPVVPQEPEYPEISLAAPADGTEYDFNAMNQVLSFGWNENEEINSYRLQFSLTPDFEVLENASAKRNPTEMGVLEMDEILGLLGLPEAKSAYVYWRVAPLRSDEFVCEPFSMFLTRLDPNTRVIAPADGMLFNLDEQKTSIAFEWRPAIGAQNHEVHFSLSSDFAKYESPYKLGAKDGRISLSPVALDEIAGKLGAEADATCEIYWRVVPSAKDAEMEAYPARKISVDRLYPYIKILNPEVSTVIDLAETDKVTLEWDDSIASKFFVDLSLYEDFSAFERINVNYDTTYDVTAEVIDQMLDQAGVMPGSSGVIYWRIAPQSGKANPSETRAIIAKRINNAVELMSPTNNSNYSCNSCDEIFFQWGAIEGIEEYDIEFSLDSDFATKEVYNLSDGENDPTSEYVSVEYLDAMLQNLGVEAESSAMVYWRIVPQGDHNKEIQSRRLTIERKDPRFWIPYEERLDDPITVKVVVIYEDPIVNEQGQRMHEVYRIGRGVKWNDPEVQLHEYIESMEEAANGRVKYEIVDEFHTDDPEILAKYNNKIFYSTSSKDHFGKKKGEYIDLEFIKGYCDKATPDGVCEYDYVQLVKDFKLDEMRRNNEVQDVWVYTHPGCGMNESRLIGKDAFWCNSGGINRPDLCDDFICVMFHNYERTTDLAMHSFGHRFESMMRAVYDGVGKEFYMFYEKKYKESQLNNWERYFGYIMNYGNGKFADQKGYAHIGLCHFPPNGIADYDYHLLDSYAYTYADEWYDYPRLRLNKRTAKRVNAKEWSHKGGYQWGYMIYFFGHMPHFKGLNPVDGHLNNWWLYCYDYKNAMKLEAKLREEMGWTPKE